MNEVDELKTELYINKITKEDLRRINKASKGRKRMTIALNRTLVKFFDFLSQSINDDFEIEYKGRKLSLYKIKMMGKERVWLFDYKYINIGDEFNSRIKDDAPFMKKISRDDALFLATHLTDIFHQIKLKIEQDASNIKNVLSKLDSFPNPNQ